MQLVLSNNRVIAHGENFVAMGGVVINTETGAKYENATVAECSSYPSDIGKVGYEYHAGTFVPCAPYGIGKGNIAVLCDNACKAIKDSGVSFDFIYDKIKTTIVTGTYDGIYSLEDISTSSGSTKTEKKVIETPSRIKGMLIFGSKPGHFAAISANGRVVEYHPMSYTIDGKTITLAKPFTGATASVSDSAVTITVYSRYGAESQKSYLSYTGYTYNYVLFL